MRAYRAYLTMAACCLVLIAMAVAAIAGDKTPDQKKGEKKMTVAEGKTIGIEYTLTLDDKQVVDTNVGGQPLTYVQGSHQIIPGLEKALEGMTVGDTKKVTIEPDQAYGQVIKEAIIEVDKDQMPEELWKVGAQVQAQGNDGRILRGKVVELKEKTAVVDFNHPLAGKTLHFDVKVLSIQ